MKEQRAIVATVTGRVQGVGYRFSTQRMGARLGLVGWVQNQFDGSVQVWAQGSREVVAELIGFLEEGPPASRVTDVSVQEVSPDVGLAGFQVR